MAVSARLETLKSKHSTLESEIAKELRYPVPDPLRLADLLRVPLKASALPARSV